MTFSQHPALASLKFSVGWLHLEVHTPAELSLKDRKEEGKK